MTDNEEKTHLPKSPSLVKLEVEHKIDMEIEDKKNTWRSLCLVVDKNAVMYFTTIFIIVGIMIFCIFKLITDDSCVAQQSYMGLLTLLLGLVAPAPTFKKK